MTPSPVVFLDAGGTLVYFDDPVGRLASALAEAGYPHPHDQVTAALRQEIAYLRDHMTAAGDADRMAGLHRQCAAILCAALENPPPPEAALSMLIGALVMRVFDEVPEAISGLRALGARLVVVSNWDLTLRDRLREVGLEDEFDAIVVSAEVGNAKPSPHIFAAACAAAGVSPGDVFHCGDDADADLAGARDFGCAAVLLDRAADTSSADVITSLAELPARVERWLAGS